MAIPKGDWQNLSTVQSDKQPAPVTVASATTVAVTGFVTFISGTTAIATITPPITGTHMLVMIHTNASPTAYTAAGNINQVVTPVQNEPVIFVYDPISATYYGGNCPV